MSDVNRITFLGLGEMGVALAGASLASGRPVTVWNRTPQKAAGLAGRGAAVAETVDDAVVAADVVVACLLDHEAVHEVLDPHAPRLAGRTLHAARLYDRSGRDARGDAGVPPASPRSVREAWAGRPG